MNKLIYIFLISSLVFSCKSETEIFPEVKNITDLKETDFSPTLESNFNTNKNIVYAVTLPLAWNEIRNTIGETLTEFESVQLEEVNNSKSFTQVLKEDEYSTNVELHGNIIRAKGYFKKSLPFEEPLTKFVNPLNFKGKKVESFGFWDSSKFADINYYINENQFSISLLPENNEHEIILITYQKDLNNFSKYWSYFKRTKEEFIKNKTQRNSWKHYFNDDDKVEIPIVEFNLQKSFDNIVGSKFKASNMDYQILEAIQRNAFILNEIGAEVESEMEFAVEAKDEEEKFKPKKMIFNKPFVVFLKRKDAINPYFGVYISNTELLKQIK